MKESQNPDVSLGMDEYYIRNGPSPTFSYSEVSSCSAIVFKCESGYAGFHYPAGSLISEKGCDYAAAMGIMIKGIENRLGQILEVRFFTPPPLFERMYEEREKDVDAILNRLWGSGIDEGKIKEAETIAEVSCCINW